ncbi:hypothetical protein ACRPLQ_04345 [Priestia sp. TRN 1309]|uniref:hypothetical protein n=1 Tax=Priestia sp. TRN 1309 TaxID=3420729 RepID=UPI003D77A538
MNKYDEIDFEKIALRMQKQVETDSNNVQLRVETDSNNVQLRKDGVMEIRA